MHVKVFKDRMHVVMTGLKPVFVCARVTVVKYVFLDIYGGQHGLYNLYKRRGK